jgi:hypothetical protein
MKKGTKILFIETTTLVLVLIFFAYLLGIIPQFVIKVSEKDFDVLKIEYVEPFNDGNNDTLGLVDLLIKTNRDNMFISAKNSSGCEDEFVKAGFHSMINCLGNSTHPFAVSPINQEHNFSVCASIPSSILYKTEPTCKSIILPPYKKQS